jgi:hypothetical protein
MSNGVLTIDEIWARVDAFNTAFGGKVIEVYGLPEEFLTGTDAWDEIRNNFRTFKDLIPQELRNTLPKEYRDLITKMTDWANLQLTPQVLLTAQEKETFLDFIAGQVLPLVIGTESESETQAKALREKVKANPFGYFKFLQKLYKDYSASAGVGSTSLLRPGQGQPIATVGAIPSRAAANAQGELTRDAHQRTAASRAFGGAFQGTVPSEISLAAPSVGSNQGTTGGAGSSQAGGGVFSPGVYETVAEQIKGMRDWGTNSIASLDISRTGAGQASGEITSRQVEQTFLTHRELVKHLRTLLETRGYEAAREYLDNYYGDSLANNAPTTKMTEREYDALLGFLQTFTGTGDDMFDAEKFTQVAGSDADAFNELLSLEPDAPALKEMLAQGGPPSDDMTRLFPYDASMMADEIARAPVGGDGAAQPLLPTNDSTSRLFSNLGISGIPQTGVPSGESFMPEPPGHPATPIAAPGKTAAGRDSLLAPAMTQTAPPFQQVTRVTVNKIETIGEEKFREYMAAMMGRNSNSGMG